MLRIRRLGLGMEQRFQLAAYELQPRQLLVRVGCSWSNDRRRQGAWSETAEFRRD